MHRLLHGWNRATLICALGAWLSAATTSTARAESAPEGPSPSPSPSPSPTVVSAPTTSEPFGPPGVSVLPSGRLLIKRPKWKDATHGRNTGLKVQYRWSSHLRGEWRDAFVADRGDTWEITFKDTPPPAGTGEIRYHVEFELTEDDRRRLMRILLEATHELVELAKAKRQPHRFSERLDALVEQLDQANGFQTANGTPASDVLLTRLGLKKNVQERGKARWVQRDDFLQRASALSSELVEVDTTAIREAYRTFRAPVAPLTDAQSTVPLTSTPCRLAAHELPNELGESVSDEELRSALVATALCSQSLSDALGRAQTADPEALAKLRARLLEIARETKTFDASKLQAFERLTVSLNSAIFDAATYMSSNPSPGIDLRVDGRALRAVAYLMEVAASTLERDERLRAKLEGISVRVEEVFAGAEIREDLLQTEPRRWFDMSTGIVYAAGLDDVVVPTFVSICPLMGCLRRTRQFWRSGLDAMNSFSVDLGLRAANIGDVDPRNRGAVALLIGGSWNPISLTRISLGAYIFENAQTRRWNQTLYIGVTIDLVQSAEILGLFGLGGLKTPTIVKPKAGAS